MNNEQQTEGALSTHAARTGIAKPRPNYKWFYVGVVVTAVFGSGSLGLTSLAPAIRWAVIAVALTYCLTLPRFLKLPITFGVTVLLAVLGLVGSTAFSSFMKASGNTSMGSLGLAIGLAAGMFYVATLLMWIGIIFYGVALGLRKLTTKTSGNSTTTGTKA